MWFGIGWSYKLVCGGLLLCDRENIVLLVLCGVKFYFVLMAWIDYPTYYVKVLDNRQVFVNSRLPVVQYRTITTRTIYCTVCIIYCTTISRSILYYVEIVGNYLYS
nr:MAG TPA: hypothetical protein [Bacteriophage sp.]